MEKKKIYILTTKAPHNRAKRHIAAKSTDLNELMDIASRLNPKYTSQIWTGNWEYVMMYRAGGAQ